MLFNNAVLTPQLDALNSIFKNYPNHKKILVVSGSIEFGASKVKQSNISNGALACIGQTQLQEFYTNYLNDLNIKCAQCLVTQSNLSIPSFVENIKLVISDLVAHNYIPIVNTNDLIVSSVEHLNDNFTLTGLLSELFAPNETMIIHGDKNCDKLDKFSQNFSNLKGVSTYRV